MDYKCEVKVMCCEPLVRIQALPLNQHSMPCLNS